MRLRRGIFLALLMPALALFTGYAENLSENQPIKDSVAAHYGELQSDLQKGEGAYLTSLLSLLHTPADEKDRTIKRMRALSEAYPSLPEFAERVPDLAHKDQTLSVPAAPAISEPDLENLFRHMKYKTPVHLSMINGDEIDGTFRSFDPSRGAIWVMQRNSTGGSDKKVYGLRNVKNAIIHP